MVVSISVANNEQYTMLCNGTCNARTDGLVHLPPALRNTVNAADLKRDEVLLMKAEKYTQRHYKNL